MSIPPELPGHSQTPVDDDDLHQFPCGACGGELAFSPKDQALKCAHCGNLQPIPSSTGTIEEIDLSNAQQQGQGKGYGVSLHSLHCESCGAITSFNDSVTSVKCAFCDSSHVIRSEVSDDSGIISPASVVPFGIDRERALEAFKTWVDGLWFKPGDLRKTWSLKEIRGIYLPFWTFDSQTHSNWTAMAGHHYYETEYYTETVNGETVSKTRQVQKTRWVPASGQHANFYDDELVCASKGLKAGMVQKTFPYDTSQLQIYQPALLAGWEAERYQIDLQEGWGIGQQLIAEQIRQACANMVPGDTHKNLRVQTQYSAITFKHVLLPMWVAAYHYKEKLFQFLVNGQTGAVAGTSPKSPFKIALAVILALLVVAGIVYLAQLKQK